MSQPVSWPSKKPWIVSESGCIARFRDNGLYGVHASETRAFAVCGERSAKQIFSLENLSETHNLSGTELGASSWTGCYIQYSMFVSIIVSGWVLNQDKLSVVEYVLWTELEIYTLENCFPRLGHRRWKRNAELITLSGKIEIQSASFPLIECWITVLHLVT